MAVRTTPSFPLITHSLTLSLYLSYTHTHTHTHKHKDTLHVRTSFTLSHSCKLGVRTSFSCFDRRRHHHKKSLRKSLSSSHPPSTCHITLSLALQELPSLSLSLFLSHPQINHNQYSN
jgi:hypothetical protein